MSKATADESFVYADADGNEEVSQKELLGKQQSSTSSVFTTFSSLISWNDGP